jgi:hypothetical protein
MPLSKGTSQKSFVKNLKTEMDHGKPQKQSLAIAYAMKRKAQKAKKMAAGGEMTEDAPNLPGADSAQDSMRKAFKYAEGGELKSGYEAMPEEHEMNNEDAMAEDRMDLNQKPVDMKESTEDADDDLVMRIMRKRYSEGGQVANQDKEITGDMPNEFDVLHLDDGLEFHDTGANSGDELGDAQEDEDRRDIVSRIMKSRAKKDRLPNPR